MNVVGQCLWGFLEDRVKHSEHNQSGVGLYHLAVERRTLPHDSTDAGFVALGAALDQLADLHVEETDGRTLRDYLRDEGVPSRMVGLAAASYSNTLGVGDALEALPLRQLSALEALWRGSATVKATTGCCRAPRWAICVPHSVRAARCARDGPSTLSSANSSEQRAACAWQALMAGPCWPTLQ